MKVSIVIPVFNEVATLRRLMDAFRAAPVEQRDIIIVDDGSIDGTTVLLDRFAKQDARIRIVHAAHQGHRANATVPD